MNSTMFGLGIALLIASAVYLALGNNTVAGGLLGGLGISAFVTLFLLGPLKRSEEALSNLVQVEAILMAFYDQIMHWSTSGFSTDGSGPPPIEARPRGSGAATP
jgi:hypothetical protein